MAVGDDDQVQRHAPERGEVRHGAAADLFRVQSAVDDEMKFAQLDIEAAGAHAAVAVEIG